MIKADKSLLILKTIFRVSCITLIATCLLLSCYPVKKMEKQVVKGYVKYPIEFNSLVSNLLPIKEGSTKDSITEIKQGELIPGPIYQVEVNVDSILKESLNQNIIFKKEGNNLYYKTDSLGEWIEVDKTKFPKIYLDCPECPPSRVDTIKTTSTEKVVIEDTRKINSLQDQINKLKETLSSKETKINILSWSLGILTGIIALYFLIFKSNIFDKLFSVISKIFK